MKETREPAAPPSLELVERFESAPLSEARANLSQLVERVAYSGVPVLISKHDRPRVAVVPLDLLARSQARFRAAAARVLAQRPPSSEAASDDVSFEEVEGLSEADLAERRDRIEWDARGEDSIPESTLAEIVNSPTFERGVERVITRMAERPEHKPEASTG